MPSFFFFLYVCLRRKVEEQKSLHWRKSGTFCFFLALWYFSLRPFIVAPGMFPTNVFTILFGPCIEVLVTRNYLYCRYLGSWEYKCRVTLTARSSCKLRKRRRRKFLADWFCVIWNSPQTSRRAKVDKTYRRVGTRRRMAWQGYRCMLDGGSGTKCRCQLSARQRTAAVVAACVALHEICWCRSSALLDLRMIRWCWLEEHQFSGLQNRRSLFRGLNHESLPFKLTPIC